MKKILSLIVITGVLIVFSCKKDTPLPEQKIGTGEIVPNGLVCVDTFIISNQNEFVINSRAENIFSLKVSFDGSECDSIDFSKYTLLGKYTSARCQAVFERNVTKYPEQKKYVYTIKIYEKGNCQINVENWNWVLIPKMETGYKIEFNVIKQ